MPPHLLGQAGGVASPSQEDRHAQLDRPGLPMQAAVSAQVMEWVLDHSPVTGTDRLVLLAISRHADRSGAGAYPSAETIAAEAAIHRVTAFHVQ